MVFNEAGDDNFLELALYALHLQDEYFSPLKVLMVWPDTCAALLLEEKMIKRC